MRCRRAGRARPAVALATLLAAGLLAGCARQVPGPVLVLHLASPDGADVQSTSVQVQHFAEQVADRSSGTMRVDVLFNADQNALQWDQVVARGVADGTWELGLVPGRAWDELGVDSLRALSAPFLVTTPAALAAVLNSDVRDDLLAGLPAAGVVGLDIFPDAMRHPFGYDQPLLGADDYAGALIRTAHSATVEALFRALGASATDAYRTNGDQRGAESQFSISPAGIATGNVTFFAKTDVLVADADARRRLRPDQWDVLRDAAAATRSWAIAQQPSDVEAALTFCGQGGRIVAASPEQIASLKEVGNRVVDDLRKDATVRRILDRLRALTAGLPAPMPLNSCPGASGPPASGRDESLLDGTYTAEVSAQALHAAGVRDEDVVTNNSGVFTWTLQGGRWTNHQRADHYAQGADTNGRYTYRDGVFTLYWPPGDPSLWTRARLQVSRAGTIHFTHIVDSNPAQQALSLGFFGAPWVRIGGVPQQP
jgi:TRAP-type C4-dicarboxylate transport system substrate-binding protein